MFQLHCLGEASLRNAAGDLIRFRSRKHLALLIYLALNAERAHRRERLAGLLWTESDDSRARHSLSQALYAVRRMLDGAIRIEGEDLEVTTNDLWVDSLELEKRLKSGDPVGAAEIYRGDFLEGFWVRGGQGFEDWAERERARVGVLARDALRQAIKVARDRCEWSEVTARAERLVHLDPFDEAAYAELMRALWMVGDRAGALARYEELCQVLAEELEASPAPETEELVARIRSRPVRGGWTGQPQVREQEDSPFQDPPFVGRKRELAILADEWERVKAGETRAVALVGEAGIGKTRLAKEFIDSLELEDVVVLRGRCYEAEQVLPYGPVAEALRGTIPGLDLSEVKPLWLAELARIVPEVRDTYGELPEPPELEAEGGRNRFFEGIAQAIGAACEASPVLLFVDDLHWADDSSLALLHYLLRSVTNGLNLLTAHRPEELQTRTTPGTLPFQDAFATTVQVDPLAKSESSKLVSELLGPDSRASTLDKLQRLSEGNPFFAIELAKGTTVAPLSSERPFPSVPNSIRTLFDRRFATLSGQAQALLEQAAFLGSRFRYDTIQIAAGGRTVEVQTTLQELCGYGILAQDASHVSFRHDLIREIAKEQVPLNRSTGLHARAARALVRSGGTEAEIARHFSAAGDDRRAYAYSIRGARKAESLFAIEEAAGLLELAMQYAANERTRIDIIGRLGKLYWHMRRYEKARPLLRRRLEYFRKHHHSQLELIECRRDVVILDADAGRGDVRESVQPLRQLYLDLRQSSGSSPSLELEILQKLFWAAWRAGDPRSAEETIARIHVLHHEYSDPENRWQSSRTLGIYHCYKGNLDDAERLLGEAVEHAKLLGEQVAVLRSYVGLTLLVHRAAQVELAERILTEAVPLAEEAGDPSLKAQLLCNCAACYLHLHFTDRAETLLHEAEQTLLGTGAVLGDDLAIQSNLAYLAFLQGDYDQAEQRWQKLLDANRAAGLVSQRIDCLAGLGKMHMRLGRISEARSSAAEASRLARRAGPFVDERHLLVELLARLRFVSGRREKALGVLEDVATASKSRDGFTYLAAQLTRLEFLAKDGRSNEALKVKRDLCNFARRLGATWHIQQAEELLEGRTPQTRKRE